LQFIIDAARKKKRRKRRPETQWAEEQARYEQQMQQPPQDVWPEAQPEAPMVQPVEAEPYMEPAPVEAEPYVEPAPVEAEPDSEAAPPRKKKRKKRDSKKRAAAEAPEAMPEPAEAACPAPEDGFAPEQAYDAGMPEEGYPTEQPQAADFAAGDGYAGDAPLERYDEFGLRDELLGKKKKKAGGLFGLFRKKKRIAEVFDENMDTADYDAPEDMDYAEAYDEPAADAPELTEEA